MKPVTVFKGIKGLVASGPSTKKTVKPANLHRPEGAVSIDAGNIKAGSGKAGMAGGSPKRIMGGSVKVKSNIRPEGPIKRDAANVVKV